MPLPLFSVPVFTFSRLTFNGRRLPPTDAIVAIPDTIAWHAVSYFLYFVNEYR